MTEHNNNHAPQVLHCVLKAADAERIGAIARRAHHEQISQALIEKDFRWNSTIRATQHSDSRLLTFGEACRWET